MIISYSQRILSFTIAAVSLKRRIIGDCAKLLKAIPVYRPEDYKKKGTGKVKFISSKEVLVNIIFKQGINTDFSLESKEYNKGFGIMVNNVKEILL